jgi:GNAT superfamily N-acetyltransferase
VVTRLRERLRYGLLTQEVLDRLAKIGLLFYPYLLVDDSPAGRCKPQISPPPGIAFYELGNDQAMVVAGLPCRPRQVAEIERLMQSSRCFGAFEGGALVGYVWANLAAVWTPIGGDVLFELSGRGAYFFDMYISRTHRGKRLAPWLRLRVLESLAALGRSEVYSLSLSLNRSTRRFKARLGAVEIEQRLAVGVKHVFGADLRLRSLVESPLPTPRRLRLRGWVRGS